MYQVNHKILQTPASDKHILLLEPETGLYFELNETSVVIFQSIANGMSKGEIVEKLTKDFVINHEKAAQDVDELINELLKHNIIKPHEQKKTS